MQLRLFVAVSPPLPLTGQLACALPAALCYCTAARSRPTVSLLSSILLPLQRRHGTWHVRRINRRSSCRRSARMLWASAALVSWLERLHLRAGLKGCTCELARQLWLEMKRTACRTHADPVAAGCFPPTCRRAGNRPREAWGAQGVHHSLQRRTGAQVRGSDC